MTSFLAIAIPIPRELPGAARNLLFAHDFDYLVACRHAV